MGVLIVIQLSTFIIILRTLYGAVSPGSRLWPERGAEGDIDAPGIPRSSSCQIEAEEIMPQSQKEESHQPFLMFTQPDFPPSFIRAAITAA
ncbi:hypothetical protein HC231_01235 [Brenneria izadpanahii]|uniref:Secreted protein n=1 Tax=Brenneria izadpanahii TaxID=2722756 RepID=A0ABX7USL6_9GAMM|nr:hypothetical protein [Brenneria izadpanahii]QTF06708.1 hypothetical protein HC231_01235 [Brenneria izadpanahii]